MADDLASITRSIQAAVKAEEDGAWGIETATKVLAFIEGKPPVHATVPAASVYAIDDRSAANVATLLAPVQVKAAELLQLCAKAGIAAKVISGTRSYAEQDALYAQGRTTSGRIVTNARGGFSNHNFGVAFDIGIFEQGKYLDESPLYSRAGQIGKSIGLDWGGDWRSIQDEPHFELRPEWAKGIEESAMLTRLRAIHENGGAIYT